MEVQNTLCNIICKYIAFCNTIGAIARTNSEFGQGVGPAFLSNLVCTGVEYRLLDCPKSSSTLCASGRNDAGVECQTGDNL